MKGKDKQWLTIRNVCPSVRAMITVMAEQQCRKNADIVTDAVEHYRLYMSDENVQRSIQRAKARERLNSMEEVSND